MSLKPFSLKDSAAFFDFDNTITSFDVLDDVIKRFAVDKNWMKLEESWKKGEIGSRECLEGQLKSLRATKKELTKYLDGIKVDPWTKKLFSMLRRHGITPIILSDSFSFIIKRILKNNKISGVKVFANTLKFDGDRLLPSFPHINGCARCGHCKKGQLPLFNGGKRMIYVGDGHSDMCPASEADFVFAKRPLLNYLKEKNTPCQAFKSFKDIYNYLEGSKNDN